MEKGIGLDQHRELSHFLSESSVGHVLKNLYRTYFTAHVMGLTTTETQTKHYIEALGAKPEILQKVLLLAEQTKRASSSPPHANEK
jgi:hypothetical protein